jgi:hypothetical protein
MAGVTLKSEQDRQRAAIQRFRLGVQRLVQEQSR